MTDYSISPTLDAAVARCRLGVHVEYYDDTTLGSVWCVMIPGKRGGRVQQFACSPLEATRLYRSLCDYLTPATLPAGTAADVATLSPGDR